MDLKLVNKFNTIKITSSKSEVIVPNNIENSHIVKSDISQLDESETLSDMRLLFNMRIQLNINLRDKINERLKRYECLKKKLKDIQKM